MSGPKRGQRWMGGWVQGDLTGTTMHKNNDKFTKHFFFNLQEFRPGGGPSGPDRHTPLPPAAGVMQICNRPCGSNPSRSDVVSHSSPGAPLPSSARSPPSPLGRLLSPRLFTVGWISFVALKQ